MIFKGKGCRIETDYYTDEVKVDMDYPNQIGTYSEIIEFYGEKDLLVEMNVKKIVDFLEPHEILSYKSMEDLFKNSHQEVIDYLKEERGEEWILENISEESIVKERRSINIKDILNR